MTIHPLVNTPPGMESRSHTREGVLGYGSPRGPQGGADACGRRVYRAGGSLVVGRIAGLKTTQETEVEGPKNIVCPVPCDVCPGGPEMKVSEAAAVDASTVPIAHADLCHRVSGVRPEVDRDPGLTVCWLTSSLAAAHDPYRLSLVTRV